MGSAAGGGSGWLRRLVGRSAGATNSDPDAELFLRAEHALAELEALACEGFVHSRGVPDSASAERWLVPPEPPRRNAFGRPVQEEIGSGARGSVALATGMTLSGLRTAVFLSGDALVAVHEDLCAAAERLVPLVVHAVHDDSGHAGYHRVAGCGLFQALASSGQEALDLTLVARWLAERALVPGLVATDGGSLERLRVPDEETVRAFLGRPDEPLASPTEAQRLLFGADRPRLLRWFDPDRPVATGGIRSSAEEARARVGGRVFFWDHVADLARQGMQELARLTGRPISFVNGYRLQDADLVLVGQGAAVQAARAATDELRRRRGWKVGVLGITWLRPFPAREVAEALSGRRAVAVIEVMSDPMAAETPLRREIEAALGPDTRCAAATCAAPGPDPDRLAALCELLHRRECPRLLRLDRMDVPESGGFPRREPLVQSLRRAYPELCAPRLPATEPVGPAGEKIVSAGLVGRDCELPPEAAGRLAEALAAEAGPCVRGRLTQPAPGVCDARLRAAPSDFPDPGPLTPVALLLVEASALAELGNPLATVARGGALLVTSAESPERVWASLPLGWQAEVRRRELRVFAVGDGLEAGIEAVRAFLGDREGALLDTGTLREIAWRELPAPEVTDRALPRVVRRIERVRPTHDNLPRFWGELVQPRQGGAAAEFPNPLETSGAVPAGASALQPCAPVPSVPVLDADACTGCGRCWTACPDSALGVTVLGTEALLTAASQLAGTRGKAADALRRAHRHLANRLGGQLVQSQARSLDAATCREAWSWLAGRLDLSDEERPAHEAAFEATVEALCSLRPVVTGPFFHEPERQKKVAGELLVLAVDPRACLGCNLCVEACAEGALEPAERTPERVASLQEEWRRWERLPDTTGATLARAAEHPEVGKLSAVLLSRHCAQAQVGSAAGEPGSGERLAGRWVTALVEEHAQRGVAWRAMALEEQRSKLERTVRERLAEGLSAAHMDTLAEALADVAGGRADLSALGERLDALGTPASFDRRSALRLARLAAELEHTRRRLAKGMDGLGRTRFGVAIAQGTVAEWAARYPCHPYWAPLTVAPTARGVELARGVARGLVAEHVALVRLLRRAALELEAPPDRSVQLQEIETLRWADLDAAERAGCPPLLLLGDDAALLEQGFEALTRLLDSDLPVKIVLLDGHGRLAAGPEPALVAMVHRRTFVLAGSLAHPDHFARGVLDALRWPGPALIHLHAPSPSRHGFAAHATLERARLAVEGRAHVLFRYDPSADGLFGLRASLAGNPAPDEDWGGASFLEWAAGERRFAQHFEPLEAEGAPTLAEWLALSERGRRGKRPCVEVEGRRLAIGQRMARAAAERLTVWNVLRELTGTTGALSDRMRAALAQELAAEQGKKLESLKAEYATGLAGMRAGTDPELLARLTDRLMALAGYPPDDTRTRDDA